MKHVLVLILVAFVFPTAVCAHYVPTNFADLAGTSDAIVVGDISKIDENTYSLTVEDVLAGPAMKGQSLRVRRFRDWVCAWRWADYEVGQKLLVFLTRDDEEQVWSSRGAACEGESPIVENDVHANFGVPGKSIEYKGRFGKWHLSAVPFNQVRTAILDFRAAFRVLPAKDPWRKDGEYSVYVPFERIESVSKPTTSPFRPRRPPPEFRTRSPLHRHLAETVEKEREKIQKYNAK